MTEEQVIIVQKSYEKLVQTKRSFSDCFFERLFTVVPELESLLSVKLRKQGNPLADCIGPVIDALGEPDKLVPATQKLAARHEEMGVTQKDYPYVGEALLWTLKHCSSEKISKDTEVAWAEAYLLIASTIINRSVQVREPVL